MSFRNYMGMRDYVRACYHLEETPKCEKAFMTTDAFRVLLRSVGGGSRKGRIANEDGVQLYGWRVIEKDGSLSAIITDVVESSHKSHRTSVTFDVDYEYAIHRDRYLRDLRNQKNFNLLGYIHSHPGHMTYFSQTDVDTMAEYTRSDMEVMLSGLVTLNDGKFELTMYAITQNGSTMDIWHLPLMVSDKEVMRRMPACTPKSFEQVWCEASGAQTPPDFRAVAMAMDGEEEPDQTQQAAVQMNPDQQAAVQMNPDQQAAVQMNSDQQAAVQMNSDQQAAVQMNPDQQAAVQMNSDQREELQQMQTNAPEEQTPESLLDDVADRMMFDLMAEWEQFSNEEHINILTTGADSTFNWVRRSGSIINVEDAQEGEHGLLYGKMQNGVLQMQILTIPIHGIPTVSIVRDSRTRVDPPLYQPHIMHLGFEQGNFRKEGRNWVTPPLSEIQQMLDAMQAEQSAGCTEGV